MDAVGLSANQRSYWQRLWTLRYFLFSLVSMDLRSRYKRSILGVGWSLVRPLGMTAAMCLIFCKLFNIDIREYAPFLLCGVTLWQFITESAQQGCTCFLQGSAYIRQHPLPLAIFPMRTVFGSAFHSGIAFLLTLGLVSFTHGVPSLEVFAALVPTLMLVVIFGWSLAVIFGLFHTHFPDTQHLSEIMFQILFYLTPIVYPPELIRGARSFAWFIDMNPMTYLIETIRRPILTGVLPSLETYLIMAGFILAMACLALWILKKLERNLVFWL